MNIIKASNKVLKRLGYRIVKDKAGKDVLFYVNEKAYIDHLGNFDIEKYRKIQTEGNKKKLDRVWVREENIKFISGYITGKIAKPATGVCHGTRRGMEQQWFRKYLGCDVFGTEISDTALDFPNTIQWDFHEIKPEWINHFDFIYSNSLDHSYNPELCINQWMKCLKANGVCVIEYSNVHEPKHADSLDPFGAQLQVLPYLFLLWSKGKFGVVDVIDAPSKHPDLSYLKFLILKRFS